MLLNKILDQIKKHRRYKIVVFLTLLGIVLLTFRIVNTETIFFTFLLWNLFLGFLPLVFSKALRYSTTVSNSKILNLLFLILWLLFIPNSPYMITDLKHVYTELGIQWFDLVLVLIFAVNSLLIGIISLLDIFILLKQRYSTKITHMVVGIICFLGGFGIFLGRFLRFNSWDIITRPDTLFWGVFHTLLMKETWIWTLVFGGFMWIAFVVIKPLLRKNQMN